MKSSMRPLTGDLSRNLRVGVALGLAFACCYAVYVLVLWLLRGAEPFREAGTTLAFVVASYFGAGLGSGAIVGLLLPLGRSRIGAALVGLFAAVPAFFAFGMAAEPGSAWFTSMPKYALIAAVVMGPPAGLIMWYQNRQFGG
jgi:hypothetical protein